MLLATEMDSLAEDLLDEAGTDLYGANGSGDEFDSIENAADDATNHANYGGLARATYSSLNGYLATGVGTLARTDLTAAHNAVKVGSRGPSICLADVTSWTAYEGLLTAVVQAGYQTNGFPQVTRTGMVESRRALGGELGFDSIFFRGTPVVEDEKVPSGEMKWIDEQTFHFMGIDIDDYEKINVSDQNVDGPQSIPVPRGFNWSGLMTTPGQPAQIGHIYIMGNYISRDPRRMGSVEGITG
jgi:hypothetical protein